MRVPSIGTALSLAPAGGGCAWVKFTNLGDGDPGLFAGALG